MSKFYKKIVEP